MGIRLDNRVAIITGGANGIGRATVHAFANSGAAVAIWDLAVEAGQALASQIRDEGGKAAFFKVNVAQQPSVEEAVTATLAEFGKIDILINNAGITRDGQLVRIKDGQLAGKMSEADFDAVLAVNLKGVFNCTQAVVPHMIEQGYGRIVSASSVVGLYGNFGQSNYAATKGGLISMTKVWARELGKRGITANAVAPGFIATDMTEGMPEHVLATMVGHTPVQRLGKPEEVAYGYLVLSSEEAAFINGAVLEVTGGLVLGT